MASLLCIYHAGQLQMHKCRQTLRQTDRLITICVFDLRSSSTSALVSPRTPRATIGDRAFPAPAASVWNSLSESVRASSSLPVFRGRLKTELLSRSYSCSDYYHQLMRRLLRDSFLTVTCPCSLRTICHIKVNSSNHHHHHHHHGQENTKITKIIIIISIFDGQLSPPALQNW